MRWQRGVRWGIDVGTVRVGLARCDPDGILPSPYKTVRRDAKRDSDIEYLARLATTDGVIRVYVGLPHTLRGTHSSSTVMAIQYAQRLSEALSGEGSSADVRMVDERFTSVSAHRALREAGMNEREQRRVVDQVAAAEILRHAIHTEKSSGEPAGRTIPLGE